jgi:hypothetical protein
MNVEESTTIYQTNTPPEMQAKIDLGEVDTRIHKNSIEKEVVSADMCS